MSKKMKYIFLALITAVGLGMVTVIMMQPGVRDLKGDFKELAFVRNEQNTGAVIRVYAVSVADTLWNNMLKYGNYMPHNKYGITRVYFFSEDAPAPSRLYLGKENMDTRYTQYCIGMYEKNIMSQANLVKYPFRRSTEPVNN